MDKVISIISGAIMVIALLGVSAVMAVGKVGQHMRERDSGGRCWVDPQ